MSIASEISRLQTAKQNIKTSIEGKGVNVPSNATLSDYPTLIDSIEGGGDYDGIIKTLSEDEITASGDFRPTYYITEVTIPSGFTSIYQSVFNSWERLENVTIPDTVTKIGESAFYRCRSLKNISLPNSLTSIGKSAFYQCTFSSITIPDSVTSIGQMAFSEASLESIDWPSGVTKIEYGMFKSCPSLSSITIPDSVASIEGEVFNGCQKLTNIDLPSGITSLKYATFNGCRSLTSIDLPSGLTSMENYVFQGCSKLQSVTINAITPPTLTSYAFYNTPSTMVIYVPCEAVDTYKAANGWSTYASQIQEIPNSCPPKVKLTLTGGTTVEKECDGNTQLSYYGDITGLTANKTDITEAKIGNCVTTIENNTFYNCTNLSNITIPSTVTGIGNSVFENCSKLASIDLPNGLVSIGGSTFKNCSSLTSLTIGTVFDHFGQEPFYNCSSLQSITIKATTPPTLLFGGTFDSSNNYPIYVPSESVETYKTASGWSTYASRIFAIE